MPSPMRLRSVIKSARRFTPGSITGSINLQTLAVTLVGETSSGGGGGGGNQG